MDMKDFKIDTSEKITTGFQIPEGYWEAFSEKVMQRIPKEEPKVISFYARNKKWIYTAAAILILTLSLPIVNQLQNKEQELSSTEIENYLTLNKSVSDDDLVNLLEQEDIEKLKVNTPITKDALEDELSNNIDLEQYITNEN
ncbi:hypothetical protein [Flavobacterium sp.]|jgi:hypothetical protein|uniref:hypothetical protein n=1 Tax=Flavobacterium sp. TaxID=239 RepID=UPI0037C0871B